MAKKISQEQIIKINELYLEKKTYAGVARELGISASTVKKYVIKDYIPIAEIKPQLLTLEQIKAVETYVMSKEELNNPDILQLTIEEALDMYKFWEALVI